MRTSVTGDVRTGPVNGVDEPHGSAQRGTVNGVDLDDIPLAMAKAQLGRAFRDSVEGSGGVFKEFGDKGRISRVCSGEDIPDWLARAWARRRTRRELVLALADESGFFEARMQLTEKKGA